MSKKVTGVQHSEVIWGHPQGVLVYSLNINIKLKFKLTKMQAINAWNYSCISNLKIWKLFKSKHVMLLLQLCLKILKYISRNVYNNYICIYRSKALVSYTSSGMHSIIISEFRDNIYNSPDMRFYKTQRTNIKNI